MIRARIRIFSSEFVKSKSGGVVMSTNLPPGVDEIEALARHEEAICDLYKAYADKFPEFREFWSQLATEETGHAAWIRKFSDKLSDGSAVLKEGRFRIPAIETSIQYLNGYTQKARKETMDITHALTIALDIENALIDRKFFEVYETDDKELIETLNLLEQETRRHRQTVEDMLNQTRHSGEFSA
jgi:hypothetical protein